ncbi:hypothetical protein CLJ_B1956 [Clostridium botulinum Ba4 str. 657]|uniref:Uncharacterized protein n=1 Tax=Clostridium botulinum (strain 657 / Type Ba4) TaxID=515621 RepID=A0A3F2ZRW7_CLOB6|nr:hypothetical protein CLJ_B1956 [Clostridium botulinum Ba4 str. 657]
MIRWKKPYYNKNKQGNVIYSEPLLISVLYETPVPLSQE